MITPQSQAKKQTCLLHLSILIGIFLQQSEKSSRKTSPVLGNVHFFVRALWRRHTGTIRRAARVYAASGIRRAPWRSAKIRKQAVCAA
jgi:hypothetical protein